MSLLNVITFIPSVLLWNSVSLFLSSSSPTCSCHVVMKQHV